MSARVYITVDPVLGSGADEPVGNACGPPGVAEHASPGSCPHHGCARRAPEAWTKPVRIRREVWLPSSDAEELGTGPNAAGWASACAFGCDCPSPRGKLHEIGRAHV